MGENRKTLGKALKPHWVWAIALGSSIGWGAFVQPVTWMETAGPLGVMLGFLIGALLMVIIAVSYGFLIKEYPVSGGEFAYAYIGFGRTHAFFGGWFLTLGYICIVALNASAFALMFKFISPTLMNQIYLYEVAGWNVYMTEVLVATISLLLFTYFNIRGAETSGRLQFIFCLVMIGSVVVLALLMGYSPQASISNMNPLFSPQHTTLAAVLSIVAIAPWAFVGFDNVPQVAEEFNFSSQKAFRLIIFALLSAAALYILMIYVTAIAQPWLQLAGEGHIWGTGEAVKTALGSFGMILLIVALSMGIFTGLNGFIVSASRLLFGMSRAKVLPKAFSKLHSKYNTPYISILFTVLIALSAPWFGRAALLWVVDMSSIGVSIAYFYTCFTAYKLFGWSHKDTKAISIAPIKKIIALLGSILSLCFIALLLIPASPAFLGVESRISLLIWTIIGLIFYLIKRREFNKIPEEEMRFLVLGEKHTNENIDKG